MNAILEKVTYHAVYDASILDALTFAKANGFAGVQVAVEAPHLTYQVLTDGMLDRIRAFREDNGLILSLHGPDAAASLYTSTGPLRDGMLAYYEELFDFAAKIGAHLVTIHLGLPPSFPAAPRPGQSWDALDVALLRVAVMAHLQWLLQFAAGRVTLCVENFALEPWAMDALQDILDEGKLCLCWDLAKGRNDEALQAFYWRNLDRVRQVHLHDVRDGYSHEVIGCGEMAFMAWLEPLAAAAVTEYCIEVRPRQKALESLANLRTLLEGSHT